jgi:hypothetical protein
VSRTSLLPRIRQFSPSFALSSLFSLLSHYLLRRRHNYVHVTNCSAPVFGDRRLDFFFKVLNVLNSTSLNGVYSGPSVYSLKKAMQTYARQGGTSAIFVNDDGLQLLSPEERDERIAFYADHNIGWVARPAHSSDPEGFKRAGRFKKASNMNYGLQLSLKLEKHLLALDAAGEQDGDGLGGQCLEDKAMNLAVEEVFEETGGRWKPWASNGKSVRVGEIILIVDSDTVVPEARSLSLTYCLVDETYGTLF